MPARQSCPFRAHREPCLCRAATFKLKGTDFSPYIAHRFFEKNRLRGAAAPEEAGTFRPLTSHSKIFEAFRPHQSQTIREYQPPVENRFSSVSAFVTAVIRTLSEP